MKNDGLNDKYRKSEKLREMSLKIKTPLSHLRILLERKATDS